MLQHLGNVIYWTASSGAVLCFLFFVIFAVTDADPGEGIGFVVAGAVIAGLIWLAGKAARYVLAR
jgi:hypothetical protein